MHDDDPKTMARRLRAELAATGTEIGHSRALELVARLHGHRDWNTMAALAPPGAEAAGWTAVPILRMFDPDRTLKFYTSFLGFTQVWEHRFADHAPLYVEVEREGVRLHLSEHHGDATPGSAAIIEVADAAALQAELIARDYPYARPGLEQQDWGLTVTVGDPASNRLIFLQPGAGPADRLEGHGGPIEHELLVPVPPVRAWDAFVDLGGWWDPRYTPDSDTFSGAVVGQVGEPVLLLHGAQRFPIGVVTRRDPGVAYEQTFTLALDPDHPTTLEVLFDARADGGTRVRLRHGGWDAANASERGRFTDWPILLERYAAHAAGA